MENSSASVMFMVIIRIMMDRAMFSMISTSSIHGRSGITRNRTMTTTISDIALLRVSVSYVFQVPTFLPYFSLPSIR